MAYLYETLCYNFKQSRNTEITPNTVEFYQILPDDDLMQMWVWEIQSEYFGQEVVLDFGIESAENGGDGS